MTEETRSKKAPLPAPAEAERSLLYAELVGRPRLSLRYPSARRPAPSSP